MILVAGGINRKPLPDVCEAISRGAGCDAELAGGAGLRVAGHEKFRQLAFARRRCRDEVAYDYCVE